MCLRCVGENPTLQKKSNSTTNRTLYNYNRKPTQVSKVRVSTFRQFLFETVPFTSSVSIKHYYSTLTNGKNFYQWFVGFADAESSFSIVPKSDKISNINRFSFMFKISLHKDDKDALIQIQNNLGFGKVSLDKDECKFVVTKQEDINKLILILDKYNLNTTKYLDYINFKKAFLLYHGRDSTVTPELIGQILDLKNGMNISRTDFNMPANHNILINKNWLLGLIEGEGSFQL